MSSFVVFNDVEWKPPVKTTLLTAPVVKIKVEFPDDDLKEMVDKQRKAFDAEFKKFDAEFNKLGQQKIKTVQEAITWTEKRVAEKKTPNERKEVVETANKMLKQAFDVFQLEIAKLAQKWFDAAVEKSYQVMKMKIVKARAKAIAKIVVIVLLTLTVAALSIAATVATGGAAAPLVIGALVVGIKAAWSVYKTIDKEWVNAQKQMAVVQKDVDTLKAATGKLETARREATTGATGTRDKLKALTAAISGKMVDLDKHVGQLDKFIFQASQALKKQNDELNKISDQFNKSGDQALTKQANELMLNIMRSLGALRAMDDVKTQAKEIKAAWDREQKLDLGRLDAPLKKVNEAAPFLIQVGTLGKQVFSASEKLAKALK